MSVNDMITSCMERYINAHMKVTSAVVYNKNLFWIASVRDHSGTNTTICNGADTSLIG